MAVNKKSSFVVVYDHHGKGVINRIVSAGSLDEAVEYVRRKYPMLRLIGSYEPDPRELRRMRAGKCNF